MTQRKDIVPAFWYLSNNFGDALTPYLIRKMSGKMPIWTDPNSEVEKVMVTGSILNVNAKNAVVWGCGIAESFAELIPNRDVRAVRGNLTLQRMKEKLGIDVSDIAVGDPCLLLPEYYKPKHSEEKTLIGIIPHYVDAFHLINSLPDFEELKKNGIKIIDINDDIEKVVDEINSCDIIISSSLHGLICADAYNIPAYYIKITDNVGGDGFKFLDWFSNFNNRQFVAYNLSEPSIGLIHGLYSELKKEQVYELNIDLDKFKKSCPFI